MTSAPRSSYPLKLLSKYREGEYDEEILKRSPDPSRHPGVDIICETRLKEIDLHVNQLNQRNYTGLVIQTAMS